VAAGLQGERPEGDVADHAADQRAQPDVEHRRAAFHDSSPTSSSPIRPPIP